MNGDRRGKRNSEHTGERGLLPAIQEYKAPGGVRWSRRPKRGILGNHSHAGRIIFVLSVTQARHDHDDSEIALIPVT